MTAIITLTVKQSVSQLTTSDLTSKSQAASYQTDKYFSKYVEIARQMSTNTQFEQLFEKSVKGTSIISTDGYLSKADWVVTERPWYKQLMQAQGIIITEPYQDTATKAMIVSVVAPVYEPGTKTLLGVTSIDFNLDQLYSMMNSYKLVSCNI